jgi:hypothetical protein
VRKERLELSRREALEPKSSVSTNFTTSAIQGADIIQLGCTCQGLPLYDADGSRWHWRGALVYGAFFCITGNGYAFR